MFVPQESHHAESHSFLPSEEHEAHVLLPQEEHSSQLHLVLQSLSRLESKMDSSSQA